MSSEKVVKVKSAEELKEIIEAYFEKCHEENEPVTITGLALALNMSRESLLSYGQDEGCLAIIKKARLRVQNAYEKRLIKRGNSGDVFALKTFGWTDKTEGDKNIKVKTALVAFEDEKEIMKALVSDE